MGFHKEACASFLEAKRLSEIGETMGQLKDLSSARPRDSCKYSKVLEDLKIIEMQGALNTRNCLIGKIRNARMTHMTSKKRLVTWARSIKPCDEFP